MWKEESGRREKERWRGERDKEKEGEKKRRKERGRGERVCVCKRERERGGERERERVSEIFPSLQGSKLKLDKKCLYIQEYMSTMVVLLADSGLHLEHQTLNQLVRQI